MAQYTVTHACGHEQVHHLYGRSADRESRINWLSGRACTACWMEARQQQRQTANAEAETWAAAHKLPPLEGSEKQCAWAEQLRRERLERIARECERIAGDPEGQRGASFGYFLARLNDHNLPSFLPAHEPFLSAILENPFDAGPWGIFGDYLLDHDSETHSRTAVVCHAVYWLFGHVEAKWWIDNRYKDLSDLIREKVEEPERLAKKEAERKAQIEAAAAKKREGEEKVRKEWEYNDAVAVKAREVIHEPEGNFTITVWSAGSDSADRRVYFDQGRGGYSHRGWKICVYRGGNSKHRPGEIEGFPNLAEEEKTALRDFAEELCKKWISWKHYVPAVKSEAKEGE